MAQRPDRPRLLSAWTEGDERALDDLMPLVYQELHRIAPVARYQRVV